MISRLENKLDLQHTCGYITLVNFPKKRDKTVKEAGGEAKRESSPAVGDKMDLQLLEEELDKICCSSNCPATCSDNDNTELSCLCLVARRVQRAGRRDRRRTLCVLLEAEFGNN